MVLVLVLVVEVVVLTVGTQAGLGQGLVVANAGRRVLDKGSCGTVRLSL